MTFTKLLCHCINSPELVIPHNVNLYKIHTHVDVCSVCVYTMHIQTDRPMTNAHANAHLNKQMTKYVQKHRHIYTQTDTITPTTRSVVSFTEPKSLGGLPASRAGSVALFDYGLMEL